MEILFEFMEDFDNSELDNYEWKEQLRDACKEYNEKHGTKYDPDRAVVNYLRWLHKKRYE